MLKTAKITVSSSRVLFGVAVVGHWISLLSRNLEMEREGLFQEQNFFDAMWDHLGASVRVIEGNWSDTNPNWTTNLDAFNAALRNVANLTEKNAALNYTPTGSYARRKKFANATIVMLVPAGARGNYTDVVVQFAQ